MKVESRKERLLNKIKYLLVLFPVVNFVFALLMQGDGLLSLYISYSFLLLILYIMSDSSYIRKMKRRDFIIIACIILLTVAHLVIGLSSFTQIIVFDLAMIYWLIYAKSENGADYL